MPGRWAPALAAMYYLKTVQAPGGEGAPFVALSEALSVTQPRRFPHSPQQLARSGEGGGG